MMGLEMAPRWALEPCVVMVAVLGPPSGRDSPMDGGTDADTHTRLMAMKTGREAKMMTGKADEGFGGGVNHHD